MIITCHMRVIINAPSAPPLTEYVKFHAVKAFAITMRNFAFMLWLPLAQYGTITVVFYIPASILYIIKMHLICGAVNKLFSCHRNLQYNTFHKFYGNLKAQTSFPFFAGRTFLCFVRIYLCQS